MKVIILTIEEFAFNKYGGFGFVAQKVTQLLKQNGYLVTIVDTLISPNKRDLRFEKDGISIHFLRKKPGVFEKLFSVVRLAILLKKIKPQILLCVSEQVMEYCYFAKRTWPKMKIILWFQDLRQDKHWKEIFQMQEEKKAMTGGDEKAFWRKLRVKRFLRKISIKSIDEFISQANFLKKRAREIYKIPESSIKTIANPIEVPPENEIKKSKSPLILFLARLDPIKRPVIFFELAKKFPQLSFVVLGKTHFPEIMNPIIERYKTLPNLYFLGFDEGQKKREVLSKAWILVNTSIYESLPVSFLEALANKMAILSCHNPDNIAERFGCFIEDIEEKNNIGKIVSKFAEGLEYLLKENKWQVFGEKGYRFVKSFASQEKVLNDLNLLFNEKTKN